VTVASIWWLCSLAEEYTDIRLLNESCSGASYISASGSPDFKGFAGVGPYALVEQTLALAFLHAGMGMLISYTGSYVTAAEMRNNRTDHCKTERLTFRKKHFF